MIGDLIAMYWEQVIDSRILHGQCKSEKIIIFRDIKIDFPYIEVDNNEIIPFPPQSK